MPHGSVCVLNMHSQAHPLTIRHRRTRRELRDLRKSDFVVDVTLWTQLILSLLPSNIYKNHFKDRGTSEEYSSTSHPQLVTAWAVLPTFHHGCIYCQDAASYCQQRGVPADSQRGSQEGLPHGGHGLLLHHVLHCGENTLMVLFWCDRLKLCGLIVAFEWNLGDWTCS